MFDAELTELIAQGYALAGRVGYLDRFELRARTDGDVERIDRADFMQVVGSRSAKDVVVRIESPGLPSPQVVVLALDRAVAPTVLVQVGGLYLGGAYRVVERIDDPTEAEARWNGTTLPACWVSEPARSCC